MSSRRPPPRPAPNTAARSVLVVAVVLLLGFVILKKGFDSSASIGTGGGSSTTSTAASTSTTIPTTTTSIARGSFKVVVANASGKSGAAKRQSDKMKADGFNVGDPVQASQKADTTTVYFVSGNDAAGAAVAAYLNVGTVAVMPATPPAPIGDAQVLVVEGKDIASDAVTPTTPTSKG